ncbi:MAG: hypothetical protein AB7G93_00935 [Bdellovibrionales bacterium]
MIDIAWLSQEARSIHAIFESLFYGLAVVFILLAVVTELLSMPIGSFGWTPQLIGRVLIAAFLLHSYPEVTNALSSVTDAIATKIGGFNEFHHVLDRMGDRLKSLTWSWISIKDALILGFSFVTFFLLYISVFIANAGIIFVWLLLYVFSPLLIVFFILPPTAHITKALYRALIEVCAWKVVWATLAALLWSSALSELNKSDVNFLTVISLNLILALSLLFTPIVVNMLASRGLSAAASSAMGLAAGAAAFTPGALATKFTRKSVSKGWSMGIGGISSGIGSVRRNFRPEKRAKEFPVPKPPTWLNDTPMPKAPPPWLQAKLDREKARKGKRK